MAAETIWFMAWFALTILYTIMIVDTHAESGGFFFFRLVVLFFLVCKTGESLLIIASGGLGG